MISRLIILASSRNMLSPIFVLLISYKSQSLYLNSACDMPFPLPRFDLQAMASRKPTSHLGVIEGFHLLLKCSFPNTSNLSNFDQNTERF